MSRPANPDGPGRSERSMRSLIRQALVAAAAGCLVACGGGSGGGSSDPVSGGAGVERVDAAMKAFVRRQAPPGVAVAVARGGRLVFAGAYGSADLAGAEHGPDGSMDVGHHDGGRAPPEAGAELDHGLPAGLRLIGSLQDPG